MGTHSVIEFSTGVPGAGKTLMRGPRYLVEEMFRDDPTGNSIYYSNLPLNVDAIAHYVAKLYGVDAEQVAERIVPIPEKELRKWRDDANNDRFTAEELERRHRLPEFKHCEAAHQCIYGPWQLFHGMDLNNCRVAIDELHHYCGKKSNIHVRKAWQRWLAEARHMGVTVEGLTQDSEKVAEEFSMEAAVRRTISHRGTDLDPWFSIPYGDWYELRAGLWTRKYNAKTVIVERRKTDEQWKATKWELVGINAKYFPLYNSFSAPQAGGGLAAISQKYEFQKRPRFSRGVAWAKRRNAIQWLWTWLVAPVEVGLIRWFVARNFGTLSKRFAYAFAVIWFFSGHLWGAGGILGCYTWTSETIMSIHKQIGEKRAQEYAAKKAAAEAAKPKPARAPAAATRTPGATPGPPGRAEATPAPALETVALSFLQPDRAGFQKGHVYGIGQRINTGPLVGDCIERIDCENEIVVMRSGLILHMGVPTQPTGLGFGAPAVGGAGEPSGRGFANPFVANRQRSAADDERARNAAEPVGAGSGETNGVLDNLRR